MAEKAFLLMIGDDGAVLLPPRSRKGAPPIFADGHTDEQTQDIISCLNRSPRRPVHILIDLQAQQMTLATIPPISYFDRKKLLERRLQQTFPQTALRASLKAPDNQELLIALDETETLNFWRKKCAQLSNPSDKTSLLPIELAGLLQRIMPETKDGWGVLLIWHKTGGFRQIVTHKGFVVFTRLTPSLPSTTHVDFATSALTTDIQATRRYLGRLGLANKDALPLVAILPQNMKSAFQKAPLETSKTLVLTPQEAGSLAKLHAPIKPKEENGDLLSLYWVAQKERWQNVLMTPQDREKQKEKSWYKCGLFLTFLVLAFTFLHLGLAGIEIKNLYQQKYNLRDEITQLDTTFLSLKKSLSPTAQPLGRLHEAVEKRRFFTQTQELPNKLIAPIAQALQGQAQILNLLWQRGEMKIDLRLIPQEEETSLTASSRGKISRQFDAIARSLQDNLPDYHVQILSYPFPNLPQETLTNKSAPLPDPIAQFLIRKEIVQ